MARAFDGASWIETSTGALSATDGGPITIVAIVRATSTRGGIIEIRDSTSAAVVAINADDPGAYYFSTGGGFKELFSFATTDNWHVVGCSKGDGSSVPRGHKYVYDTNTWTHVDASGTNADSSGTAGASGSVQLGRALTAASDRWDGDIAIVGVWLRELTDAEIEPLALSLQAWYAHAPDAGWLFDQSATTQKLVDFTGKGANESAITGTSVSTVSVPVFSYGHDALVPQGHAASGGQSVNLGQVAETDTAQALARSKTRALGQVAETDTAQALARSKQRALGQVAETDTAQPLSRSKTRTLGQIVETDTAQALARAKALAVGQVTESDTARAIGTGAGVPIGQVTETDTAQALARSKTLAIGQVLETDAAQALARTKALGVGQVAETDTARALTAQRSTAIGQVSETDTARTFGTAKAVALGRVTETDTAQTLTAEGGGVDGIIGRAVGLPSSGGGIVNGVNRSLLGAAI